MVSKFMSIIKNRYTVYNLFTKADGGVLQVLKDAPDLLKIKEAESLIGIDRTVSDDDTFCEIKVSWTSEEDYYKWRDLPSTNYEKSREQLEKYYRDNGIVFDRYTSLDGEYTSRTLDHPKLISNIALTKEEKKYFINHLLPLGKLQEYIGWGKYKTEPFNIGAVRFLKDRNSDIVRRYPSDEAVKSLSIPRNIFAFSFDNAIDYSMYDQHNMWLQLKKLCNDVELYAEKLMSSCSNAAIIVGHKSLGSGIIEHLHRIDEEDRPTLTITVRISFDDNEKLIVRMYEPVDKSDVNLPTYYPKLKSFQEMIKDRKFDEFKIKSPISTMMFNGSYIPHSTTWTDDIYLFFIFDNVEWKNNSLEKIKAAATSELNVVMHDTYRVYITE
jgi:hypothetical protein